MKLLGVRAVPVGVTFLQKLSPEPWGGMLRGQRNQKPPWAGAPAVDRPLSERMALQVFAQRSTYVSAEERFADGIVRSLRSTLAFRHHVLPLTAILSRPVGAALSVGELVPGTLLELDQDCSFSDLWHLQWPGVAGRHGLSSGLMSPGLMGSGVGSCLARLVSLPWPRLLGQLGPAVQQIVPEAGDVLCVLGQRAIQLVHMVP